MQTIEMKKLIFSTVLTFLVLSSVQGQKFSRLNPLQKKGNTYYLPVSELEENADTSGKVTGESSKRVYTYDSKGRSGVDSIYLWDFTIKSRAKRAYTYLTSTYDGMGNVINSSNYIYDSTFFHKFEISSTDTFNYDANGNLISQYWTSFKYGVKNSSGRRKLTYNAKGQKLTDYDDNWDSVNNVYYNYEYRKYTYDASGYMLNAYEGAYGYPIDSGVVYYSPNHLEYYTIYYETQNGKTYIKRDSVFVKLDVNGNVEKEAEYFLAGNGYQFQYSSKNVYDANDNVLTSLVSYSSSFSELYTYTYQSFTGVESETNIHSQFSIFPNPCSNTFTIDLKDNSAKPTSIIIRNMQGQEVKNMMINNTSNVIIDISELPKGIYLLTLISGEKCITQKLVKSL